jgi:hypothetical protein
VTDSAPTCWQLSRGARGQQHAPVPTTRRSAPPSVFVTKWLCALVWYTFSHPFETDCRRCENCCRSRGGRDALDGTVLSCHREYETGITASAGPWSIDKEPKEPKEAEGAQGARKPRCPAPRSRRSTRSPRSPPGPKSKLSQEPYELSASCASGPVESKKSPRSQGAQREPSQKSPNRSRSPDEPKG